MKTAEKLGNPARTLCLRPKDPQNPEFLRLWEERNAVILEIDVKSEAICQAAARGDSTACEQLREQLVGAQAEHDRLSTELRPLQDVAWERTDNNVVTLLGRNDMNDKYWRGSAYTQTIAMGLAGVGAKAAADTMASHAAWLEVGGANAPAYTGARKLFTMALASSQSSVSPQQSFAITSAGTVAGLFCVNGGSTTKDDTTGVLVNAVDFTGGNEVVANLDTLLVTYTFNG